jgi:hypothetical protein
VTRAAKIARLVYTKYSSTTYKTREKVSHGLDRFRSFANQTFKSEFPSPTQELDIFELFFRLFYRRRLCAPEETI